MQCPLLHECREMLSQAVASGDIALLERAISVASAAPRPLENTQAARSRTDYDSSSAARSREQEEKLPEEIESDVVLLTAQKTFLRNFSLCRATLKELRHCVKLRKDVAALSAALKKAEESPHAHMMATDITIAKNLVKRFVAAVAAASALECTTDVRVVDAFLVRFEDILPDSVVEELKALQCELSGQLSVSHGPKQSQPTPSCVSPSLRLSTGDINSASEQLALLSNDDRSHVLYSMLQEATTMKDIVSVLQLSRQSQPKSVPPPYASESIPLPSQGVEDAREGPVGEFGSCESESFFAVQKAALDPPSALASTSVEACTSSLSLLNSTDNAESRERLMVEDYEMELREHLHLISSHLAKACAAFSAAVTEVVKGEQQRREVITERENKAREELIGHYCQGQQSRGAPSWNWSGAVDSLTYKESIMRVRVESDEGNARLRIKVESLQHAPSGLLAPSPKQQKSAPAAEALPRNEGAGMSRSKRIEQAEWAARQQIGKEERIARHALQLDLISNLVRTSRMATPIPPPQPHSGGDGERTPQTKLESLLSEC